MDYNQILIFLAIFTPLIGALLSWPLDRIKSKLSAITGVTSIGISAIASLAIFIRLANDKWDSAIIEVQYWILQGSYHFGMKLSPDPLGGFIAMIASFLGLLIAIFSLQYMSHDKVTTRYWVYLQAFIFGMVTLVIAGDLISMYVGWEMVGLCSFGLISHYHYKMGEEGRKAGLAGIKAFVFTRIGDIGFLVAIVLLYNELGTIYLNEIAANSSSLSPQTIAVIGILFIIAAFGKSAQFPFIPWLSSPEKVDIDAMQGPTTVSALIHAATMVKAGVYLVARMYLILPVQSAEVLGYILIIIASITALIAAMSALVSIDIKRILAYSTVSQLAYMFLILGVAYLGIDAKLSDAAFMSGIYHLFSHAIFKSLLFLSAGYLIHHVGSRSILDLQGHANWKSNKLAFTGFVAGGLSLAGIPPFIGFFSKEPLIGTIFATYEVSSGALSGLVMFAYLMAVITAIFTALYTARMLYILITPKDSEAIPAPIAKPYDVMGIVVLILSSFTIIMIAMQFVLPSYFESQLAHAEIHRLDDNILHTILLTLGIIAIFVIGYVSQGWSKFQSSLGTNPVSRSLITISKEGFYLDSLWMGGWEVLKQGSYAFRRTHSGKINNMVLYSTVIAAVVLIAIIGGS